MTTTSLVPTPIPTESAVTAEDTLLKAVSEMDATQAEVQRKVQACGQALAAALTAYVGVPVQIVEMRGDPHTGLMSAIVYRLSDGKRGVFIVNRAPQSQIILPSVDAGVPWTPKRFDA